METLETFNFLTEKKNEILDSKIEYLNQKADYVDDIFKAVANEYGLDSMQMQTLHLAFQPFINHLFDELRESEIARRGNTHD